MAIRSLFGIDFGVSLPPGTRIATPVCALVRNDCIWGVCALVRNDCIWGVCTLVRNDVIGMRPHSFKSHTSKNHAASDEAA